MKSYIAPILCLILIVVVIVMSVKSCKQPTDNNLKDLERTEEYYRNLADSLSKNTKLKTDTFKVTVEKIKIKNKIIYVKQDSVMALSTDSGIAYLMLWSGQPVIKD